MPETCRKIAYKPSSSCSWYFFFGKHANELVVEYMEIAYKPSTSCCLFHLCFKKEKPGVFLDILCKLLRSEHNLPATTNAFVQGDNTTWCSIDYMATFFAWNLQAIAFYLLVVAPYFHFFNLFLRGKQAHEFTADSMKIAYKTSTICYLFQCFL